MTAAHRSIWKLPALSGALLVLAYYGGVLVPSLLLFLPLLLWLDLNEDASRLRRLWAGFVFGGVAFAGAAHFHYAMLSQSWLAAPLYLGVVLAYGLKVALSVALLGWLRARSGWSYALLLPMTWLSVEWLQSWGDLKMTLDHVGQTLAPYPFLVQFADLVGTYGVGLFVLLFNGLLYESLYGFYALTRRRAAVALVLLVAAVLAYDGWAWQRTARELAAAPAVRAAFVQPNVPLELKHAEGTEQQQWNTLERLTREAVGRGAELVVWPETARPDPFFHHLDYPQTYRMDDVQLLARSLGVSLLVGADYYPYRPDEPIATYNAAFVAHPDGTLDPAWGGKVYLVPFTEKTPFEGLLGPLLEGRGGEWRWVSGGFRPAPENALLPASGTQVGVLVCFEEFFPDLARMLKRRGAGLQAVITNDAWFGRSPFQTYMVDTARLRAIENRVAFVRAANTGHSAFIDPLGRVHGRTGLFVEASGVMDLPVIERLTVYDRIGDAVAWLCVALLLASLPVIVAKT